MKKKEMYLKAPLPFMGQKRNFTQEYIKLLNSYSDKTIFVDLFGGSGLLSHITKRKRPDAQIVYNDFDNYRYRLEHIEQTNKLLANLRSLVKGVERHKIIDEKIRKLILALVKREEDEQGYVDYITISSSLLFSMRYVCNYQELIKETLYNNVRKADYPLCEDYLDGIEVVSCDYRELFKKYKDMPGVVFLVDPPYLATDVKTYTMTWGLRDYLDVLKVLNGHSFVYFTSNESSIIELCEWMGNHQDLGNPFEGCERAEYNAHMNHTAKYVDIMLSKTV